MKKNIGKRLLRNKFNYIELFTVCIIVLFFGILIGKVFLKNESSSYKFMELDKVYDTLLKEYYGKIDAQELEEAAIEGAMNHLQDKYSFYLDKQEADELSTSLNGYFIGLGATISLDENNTGYIVDIIKNSPAEKYGIEKGDKILKVDGKDVTDKTIIEISNLIKGKEKAVTLTIQRNDEVKNINVKTGKVELESVSSEIINSNNKKIGYIYLSIFALNSDEQFENNLKDLEKKGIDSLIIDVRGNTGGHLDTTVNIASLFLDKSKVVIQIVNNLKKEKIYSNSDEKRTYPIVVLVDGGSASGAEALSIALKEEYGATIIGTQTYGKGTVQKTKSLSTGGSIKYTTDKWLSPKGNSINEVGITPDIVEELNEKFYSSLERKDDNQLNKALDFLKDK